MTRLATVAQTAMMRFQAWLPSCVFAALAACGPPPQEDPAEEETVLTFADAPLAGTIHGQPWSFAGGSTNGSLPDEEGFFAKLYGTPHDDVCGAPFDPTPKLLTSLPAEPGLYWLSLSRTLTFAFQTAPNENANDIATTGAIRIDAVDDVAMTVRGALKATMGEHEVDGTFTVTICGQPVGQD